MGLFADELAKMNQPAETQAQPAVASAAESAFGPVDLPYEGPFQDRVNKMNPELWDKFTQMALDFREATGRKLRYTDTFRTNAEQVDLYARKPDLAAKPGTSRHEFGEAIDVHTGDVPDIERLGLLEKHALTRPVLHKGETWHIQLGGPVDKARAFLNKAAVSNPQGAVDVGAGLQQLAVPPVPEPAPPVYEKPIEPAGWQDIQDPFASSFSLAMQHPEESIDPFAKGFGEGAGWGFVPSMGEHKRALGIIPANMYTFGHDIGMILPIMASLGFVAPGAAAVGATGLGTGLGAEILTPFARSVFGGAFYGAQERINEFVADAATGRPTPRTIQGWGQILGSAYQNALGFALAHAGGEATIGELGHYLGLKNFKKQMGDPLIAAAGSPEALQMAAAKDPTLAEIKAKSPEVAKIVTDLNGAAQRKLEDDLGTIVNPGPYPDVYGVYPGQTTAAPETSLLQRRIADNLAGAEMAEMGGRTPTPTIAKGEIVPPAASGEVVSEPNVVPKRELPAITQSRGLFYTGDSQGFRTLEQVTRYRELRYDPANAGVDSDILVARAKAETAPKEPIPTTANTIAGNLDQQILDIVQKVPATGEPEIAFSQAVADTLDMSFTDADALVSKALKDGVIRFRQETDGLVAVPGPKMAPTAVQVKTTALPDGMAPKAIVEPDGTNWNQAGVWMGPEGGLRHEFYVVEDPQATGGKRFVEKIFKGDTPLTTSTLISGDTADIARYMENTAHMKWQNAYRFNLGEVGGQLMYSGIPVDQFVPMLRQLGRARQFELIRGVFKDLQLAFAPESISKEGQIAAQGTREYHARIQQGIGQRENAWEAYRQDFAKMTPEERQAFISGPLREYETSGKTADPAHRPMIEAYKEACDKMIAAIEETTGKSFPYREHYFRHMWDDDPGIVRAAVDLFEAQGKAGYYDPDEIKEMVDSMRAGQPAPSTEAIKVYAGKRSLEGPKSFLRPRTIPTMADGVSWGLRSASDNPVDIIMLDLMQKHRYLLGQKFFKQLKDEGLVKYSSTSDIPTGWQPIEDKIAQVWRFIDRPGGAMVPPEDQLTAEIAGAGEGPRSLGETGFREVPAVKGFMPQGKYFAPPEVAAIVNRDLSAGLRGSRLYQMYRTPTDMLNAIAVGWSGFHWQFETVSDLSIGWGRGVSKFGSSLSKGDIVGMAKGIKDMAINTPLGAPYKILSNMRLGGKIREEILRPDFAGLADASGLDARTFEMADFAMRAGGRAGANKQLGASLAESLSNAWTDALHLRPLKTAKDLTELVSKPLMEWYVPRVKLACFSRLLEGDLENAAAKAGKALTGTEQSLVAMNTWQHIDNIFGQLVYDNLHLNKAFRDMVFMFIRFPGWNIGSVRSLTGTGRGIAKMVTGQTVDYQAKAAMEYAVGLGMNLGILGTLTNYGLTGELPKSGMDVFMPRTGRLLPDGTPERIWYASYLRDLMGFVVEPAKEILKGNPLGAPGKLMQTITAKEAPGLRLAYEFLTNKNYFGEQIFTPGAGGLQQAGELGKHFAGEYLTPFGIQQMQKARGTASGIANVLGTTSVPRRYLRSPAQEVISEYNSMKRGVESKSEAEKSQFRQDFIDAIRSGDIEQAREVGKEAIAALRYSASDLSKLASEAKEHPLVHGFKGLPLEWALKVYRVADDTERKIVGKQLMQKLTTASAMEKFRLKNEITSVFEDIRSKQETARKVTMQ